MHICIYTRDSADNSLLTVLNDLKIRPKLSMYQLSKSIY